MAKWDYKARSDGSLSSSQGDCVAAEGALRCPCCVGFVSTALMGCLGSPILAIKVRKDSPLDWESRIRVFHLPCVRSANMLQVLPALKNRTKQR